ncbi:MAG TPA: FimV/HubP family polar landmark protein [Azospira sp.]|nr:FimV/HubP family polar landmark protein [Azospira sp.]
MSATKAELSGMVAKLASQDAFQQAGIDYATTLLGIKFAIDQRPGGQTVIRLSSERPVNDPFVDMLVELNWPSGRLVREYTFLLDPPEMAPKAMPQVSTVEAKVPPKGFETRPLAESPAAPSVEEKPAKVAKSAKAGKARVSEAPKETQAKPASEAGSIEVKRGDTLRKLANENLHEGVSLDQMLVGLFRANKDAFDGANMNRLKAGRILTVPDKDSVAAVSEGEAKKIVVAQSADWNAYRRKLAGAVAQGAGKDEAGAQAAAGKITAKVEDKVAPAAESKDQVKVSKTETGRGGKPGAGKGSEEDRIAKDKALKEANERAAALEKNVGDLQKLAELKNQNMAELQKQAAAKAPAAATAAPAPAPAAKPVEPPKVAEAAKAVEPPKPAEAAPAAPVGAEAAKPEAAPVPAPTPVAEPPKPVEEAPKPKPKVVAPPPPPEEPSIIDTLLDNSLPLAGGLAALLGLGGLFAYRRRKQQVVESTTTLPPPSDTLAQPSLGANSVFKSTGGQSVDTSNTPATDFSQAGPGTIDTDEVDPVAEADVYMAYGRDAQAEEILLEAMQKDPKRFAIHAKLLEIYANRKNVKQFELLASELYAQTGGVGTEWEKVAAMGSKLDPSNPLYSGASASGATAAPAAAPAPAFDPEATMVVGAGKSIDTFTLPGAHAEEPAVVVAPAAAPLPEAKPPVVESAPLADLTSLDFDLGLGEEPAPAPAAPDLDLGVAEVEQAAMPNVLDFDLDLGAATPAESPLAAAPAPEAPAAMEFHLPEMEVAPVAAPAMEAPAAAENIIDFDLDLGEAAAAEAEAPRAFDLSAINLDLEAAAPVEETVVLPELAAEPAAEISFEPVPAATSAAPAVADLAAGTLEPEGDAQRWQEVATKLDLAKAYEEMGDMEGARELLQEVLTEGNAEQQEKARSLMEKVGS